MSENRIKIEISLSRIKYYAEHLKKITTFQAITTRLLIFTWTRIFENIIQKSESL